MSLARLARIAARAAFLLGDVELAKPALKALHDGIDYLLEGTVQEVQEEETVSTEWDPEGVTPAEVVEISKEFIPTPVDGEAVRVLMLEVLRRAAHDWVLYRSSRRKEFRQLAHDAYTWLFEEEPGHPWFELRKEEGTTLMSLVSICECIECDIDVVREHVKRMTVERIKTAGRPPERRKRQSEDTSYYNEHSVFASFSVSSDDEA